MPILSPRLDYSYTDLTLDFSNFQTNEGQDYDQE